MDNQFGFLSMIPQNGFLEIHNRTLSILFRNHNVIFRHFLGDLTGNLVGKLSFFG